MIFNGYAFKNPRQPFFYPLPFLNKAKNCGKKDHLQNTLQTLTIRAMKTKYIVANNCLHKICWIKISNRSIQIYKTLIQKTLCTGGKYKC